MPTSTRSPAKRKRSLPVRERLLRAATKLFARSGFDGTTVDEVVDTAGVNKRMVYHYFGNKEQLYQEVLAEAYRSLEVLETETLADGKDIDSITAHIVRMYFDFLAGHPEFVRLLLWENLNGGRGLDNAGDRLTKDPMVNALEKLLQKGIAEGRIRPDMDARHLLISLIGLCMVYRSNRYTLSRALHMDLGSPRVLDDGVRHVTRLLLEGIKSPK